MLIQNNSDLPIGIFDSGIGGLTVVQSVKQLLPNESILYVGDTARVPYGIKSREAIVRYSIQIINFLREQQVKMILIACNSVSAMAIDAVKKAAAEVPVLDVISAGRDAALATDKNSVGVIGTLATIGSGAYEKALNGSGRTVTVTSKACPLLVPLAEEGWTDNKVSKDILQIYLDDFLHNGAEVLILGCTHYPLFKNAIESIFRENGRDIQIIDSADAIAGMASDLLTEQQLLNSTVGGTLRCCVSDRPQRFSELAERFLGEPVEDVEFIQLS